MEKKSVFETLNAVNCNEHTEKKNGLTYLSWAWAWGIAKKYYPTATYKIYEDANGMNYHTDGRTCWVKTGVTIEGIECIEYLPIMDYRNQSIIFDKVSSMDVNKAIQRSLTKALARHGLGLYIYAGEDLPEETQPQVQAQPQPQPQVQADAVSATDLQELGYAKQALLIAETEPKVHEIFAEYKAKLQGSAFEQLRHMANSRVIEIRNKKSA